MSAALNSLLLQWNRCVASTLSDGDLLRAYLRDRAEEPFRLLVERHGGMVLGVCRHRLADAHAAEDAFQATFLLLARRAGSIRRPESVAAWLHRTAIRVCTKARRAQIRRQAREVPLSACAAKEESYSTSRSTADVLLALEEEVERLPERYRTPLLLCYWQGMTQAEAARCLGCSEGSVKARLERGRKQLAKRLTQRGLAPQSILVAPLAGARVPRELLVRTVALTPEGAAIPTEVATLVKGVTASLGSTSRYVVGALVTAVAFTLGGTATRGPQRIETPAQAAVPKEERKPSAAPLPEGAIARIGSPRLRHAGEIAAMAFSTDGRWLASASPADHDRTVRVWDLADGAEKLRVPIEVNSNDTNASSRVVAVGFSKDGQHLRVIDFTRYRVIDRVTGRQILQHRFYEQAPGPGWHPSDVIGAAFSPELSTYAVVRRNGELILGDAATGQVRRAIAQGFVTQENRFYSLVNVAFSGDGRRVCIPIDTDATKVFDTATGNVISTLRLKRSAIWDCAFLKGGDEFAHLAKADGKYIVEVVKVADGKKARQLPVEMSANCLDVSPDGKFLAVGNMQRFCVQLLDPLTGKEIRRLPRGLSEARLVFSPDSKLLASVAYSSGSVTVWETASWKRLPSSADGILYLKGFDRDGRLVLRVDGRSQITDWKTGRVFGALPDRHKGFNYATHYSPDHRLEAYHDMVKPEDWKPEKGFPIAIRDVATEKEISRLVGNTAFCQTMVFTNDSKRLITKSQDAMIRLWDIAAGKELWAEKQPFRFRFVGTGVPLLSADDRRLAILCVRSDKEMELRVWDLVTKKRVAEISTPFLFFGGIDFSSDGKFLAGGGNGRLTDSDDNGTVFVWDVDAGKIYRKLAGHSPGNISCQFAPDGRTLSTVDRTGLIRIWELATGQERFRITGHRGPTAAHFSPDSALIAGWSNEAPILIWNVYGISHSTEPFDAEKAWQALGEENAARSFTAMHRLCAAPEQAVKLLRSKLKPADKVEAETIRKWIRELDNDDFATREAAQKALEKLGDRAAEFLRATLQQSPSAETRKRVNRLLKDLDTGSPDPDRLRQQRAVEVLERIGSADAKANLADLAQGAAGARLTIEAKASLARWKQR